MAVVTTGSRKSWFSASTSCQARRYDMRMARAAADEDVRIHRGGGIQRRSHALAGVAVPRPFFLDDVDPRQLPDLELGEVRAATVAARDEWRVRLFDLAERSCNILRTGNASGVGLGPDQHEIVVHDVV